MSAEGQAAPFYRGGLSHVLPEIHRYRRNSSPERQSEFLHKNSALSGKIPLI